jgi:hypothetical protein
MGQGPLRPHKITPETTTRPVKRVVIPWSSKSKDLPFDKIRVYIAQCAVRVLNSHRALQFYFCINKEAI